MSPAGAGPEERDPGRGQPARPDQGAGAGAGSSADEGVAGEQPGLLERREIYSGRIVRLSVDRVRFPGGSTGELEHIRHRGAAAVVPFLDPPEADDPRVLLIRQYRYAAGGWIYEIPAGMPDEQGEPWETCARRELAEETGYEARELRYLTRILTTPGFTDEVIHLFMAWGLTEGDTDRDRDEFLTLAPTPLSRVMAMVEEGQIVDAKTVSALLYAARVRKVAAGGPRR